MIHDPQFCKLGKGTAIHPKGMRMMAELTSGLPAPPSAVAWYKGTMPGVAPVTSWPMDKNDKLGICTIAGLSHFVQLLTTVLGKPFVPTDAQCIAEYSRLCGYDPNNPDTDQGGVESDILATVKSTGIFGHQIEDFIGINPASQTQIKDSILFFGAAYLGVELPNSAQDQDVWDVPPGGPTGDGEPGSWGGHCVLLVGAGERGATCVTWGALKQMTWEWLYTYCSEAYALLSPDFINKSGQTPGGVPLASLRADLLRLKAS